MYYSRKHYKLVGGGFKDTDTDIENRKKLSDILTQVDAEVKAMMKTIDISNPEDINKVIKYQETKLSELRKLAGL